MKLRDLIQYHVYKEEKKTTLGGWVGGGGEILKILEYAIKRKALISSKMAHKPVSLTSHEHQKKSHILLSSTKKHDYTFKSY